MMPTSCKISDFEAVFDCVTAKRDHILFMCNYRLATLAFR